MSTAIKRSGRARTVTNRYSDVQAAAAAEEDAKRVAKNKKARKNTSTNAAAAAAASNDGHEIVGEDDNALLIVKTVNKGDIFSESQSSDAWKDFNRKVDVGESYEADKEDALNKYDRSSYLENLVDEDIDLDILFRDPTKETYANSTKEEKRNYFEVLKAGDGMENKQRCEVGYDNLTYYVRIRVGMMGRANSYAVFAQDLVSKQWVVIFYFSERKGSSTPKPGSLEYTIGGDCRNLTIPLGETVDHRSDANNNVLFRVKRVNVKVESVEEIKIEAAKNENVREIAMEKLNQRRTIGSSGLARGQEQSYYSVTKKNDPKNEYGERGVKSLSDLVFGPDGVGKNKGTGDIGKRHLHIRGKDGSGVQIGTSDLPKHVDGEVEITTAKGTFVVTRVTFETYEKLAVRNKVTKKSTFRKKK